MIKLLVAILRKVTKELPWYIDLINKTFGKDNVIIYDKLEEIELIKKDECFMACTSVEDIDGLVLSRGQSILLILPGEGSLVIARMFVESI